MRNASPFLVLLAAAGTLGPPASPGTPTMLAAEVSLYPGARWETCPPRAVGLAPEGLDALANLVGGRGCVVRHGRLVYTWGDPAHSADIASAAKPVISTLLLLAVQEGRLRTPDDRVAEFEPRLEELNGGKDAGITWRHLASQTSGYGLIERPGEAYGYNDFALALYYETLVGKVFRAGGTEILKSRLAGPLEFQDAYRFEAPGAERPGRLALSPRDFARFGLLYLRGGRWRHRQVLREDLAREAFASILDPAMPVTSGREAPMLPAQKSMGGGKNQTPAGPGFYSFNWWINGTDGAGRRMFVDAPPNTRVASGLWGRDMLWIFPGLDLVVCWTGSPLRDHGESPGRAESRCNQAARLIRTAVAEPAGSPGARLAPAAEVNGDRTP